MSLFVNRVLVECDECGFAEDFEGDTYAADMRDAGWTSSGPAETPPEDRVWHCSECSENDAE